MNQKHIFRLMKEKLENEKGHEYFYTQPLFNDVYTWHFTLKGNEESPYRNGLYHGVIYLPDDYPLSPPDICFFNKNGRFQINTKICLSITSYHKKEWSPIWTLRTMLEAVNSYFIEDDLGIGSVRDNYNNREELAVKSRKFICKECGALTNIEKNYLKK